MVTFIRRFFARPAKVMQTLSPTRTFVYFSEDDPQPVGIDATTIQTWRVSPSDGRQWFKAESTTPPKSLPRINGVPANYRG